MVDLLTERLVLRPLRATEAGVLGVERRVEGDVVGYCGHRRLWATVWDWNTASRRVLAKLGFTVTDRTEVVPGRGTTIWTVLHL